MGKAFLDTDVLVHACDQGVAAKRQQAQALVAELGRQNSAALSTQVLQEFYIAATKKLGMDPVKAKGLVTALNRFEVVVITLEDIARAMDGNILWQISFWDALILVAARKACCDTLYTEDLNHDQVIDGIRIRNPFQ